MEMKHWLSAAVGCLALALWAMPATAAPISSATTSPISADGNSIVETTHWRGRYAYYYSDYSDDDIERYYPYEEPSYRYSYGYPSYTYYYVYPRYYRHHHHHHHHHHHRYHRDYRRW